VKFHITRDFLKGTLLHSKQSHNLGVCRMFKISRRFQLAAKAGEFFSLHEWKFHCDNVCALICDAQDKTTFDVDVSQMDWNQYVKNYMFGIRRFILKDSSDSIPNARKKLQK